MACDTDIGDLSVRVARLEEQLAGRKNRGFVLVVTISTVVSFCVGFFSDIIGRHVVQVRWPWRNGVSKAVLFSSTDDGRRVGLFLDSPSGRDRAYMVINGNTGDASLQLEPEGKGGIGLLVTQDSRSYISILDQREITRFEAGVQSDGTPALYLRDQAGIVRASLFLEADGNPRLILYDKNRHILFKAP